MSGTLMYGPTYTVEMALSAATGSYGVWDAAVWGPTTSTVLNGNPYFETDLSGWTAYGGSSVTRSSLQAHQGTWSARVVPDGVGTTAFIEADQVAVTGGAAYRVYGWLFSATGYPTASVSVDWYNASHAFISTTSDTQALVAGVWRNWDNVMVAPPTAAFAGIHALESGTPAAAAVFHADELILGNGGAQWGPDTIWVDVSPYVRGWSTGRAFDRTFKGWDRGTATIELNNRDARFSPTNLAGPYVSGGVTQVRPWRPVRIRVTWAGTTHDQFTGYIKDMSEEWVEASPGAGGAVVTVRCVDELASLGRFGGVPQPAIGGGESSGRRMHRILDNAGHTGTRDIDVGRMTMQASTLSGNAAAELKLTAESEGGAVYVGKNGAVVFRGVYDLIERTTSNTVQATFGDGGGSELPCGDITAEYNGDLLVNLVAFARIGGETVLAADATSRALYGDARDARSDLMCEVDTQVQTLADLWVQRFKDPEYRLTGLELRPRGDPARMFPQVLGREVRDLIRVVKRPPGGITITQDVYISGIFHVVTQDDWTTVFALSSSRPFTSFTTSRFDVAVWDTATFFY